MPTSRDWHVGSITLDDTDDVALSVRVAGEAASFTVTAGGAVAAASLAVLSGYTQTYATADKTLGAYTADVQTTEYTAPTLLSTASKLEDLNGLRVAYENLRAFTEDLAQIVNSLINDLKT